MGMNNKHPLKLTLVLLLVFACFCSSAFAEEQAGLGLEMKADGADYTVSVQLSGTAGPEMLQCCLRYDDEMLTLQSVVPGEVFLGKTVPTISATESGRVYLAWDALSPLENGTLLELRFSAKDDAYGTARIWFDEEYDTIAADGDFNEIFLNKATLDIPVGVTETVSPASYGDTATPGEDQSIEISVGEKTTVRPDADQNPTMTSSDETVAVVKDGTVVGVSEGTALITVEYEDGTSETYQVYVSATDANSRSFSPAAILIPILLIVAVILIFLVFRKKKEKQS